MQILSPLKFQIYHLFACVCVFKVQLNFENPVYFDAHSILAIRESRLTFIYMGK